LIFVLVFVLREFELGTVQPLQGVDRQSNMGLIYLLVILSCIKILLLRLLLEYYLQDCIVSCVVP